MALQPSLAFTRLGSGPQTLEFYLDTLCPFSAKMTRSITANLLPLISSSGPLAGQLSLLIRPYVQPWHTTSTLTNEATLAVGALHPQLFWDYWAALMDGQEAFFDQPAEGLSAKEIRDKLAQLAGEVVGKQGNAGPLSKVVGEVRDKLVLKTTPNGGTLHSNDVTADLKYFVKLGRQNSIHVTPSVLFNGIFDGSVSSSWGKDEWTKFLADKGFRV